MWILAAIGIFTICFLIFHLVQRPITKSNENESKLPPGVDLTCSNRKKSVFSDSQGEIAKFMVKHHEKFGPIVSFWEQDDKLAVSINSPELFKYVKQSGTLSEPLLRQFKMLMGDDSLIYASKEEALRRRKMYDQYFMMKTCRNFFDTFNAVVQDSIKRWESYCDRDELVPYGKEVNWATMKIILKTSFGDYFSNEKHFEDFLMKYEYLSAISYEKENSSGVDQKTIKKYLEEIVSTVKKIADARKKENTSGEESLFIDVLLREDFTETQRTDDMRSVILGAYQDVGGALGLVLYEVTSNKDIQEKLYSEVMSILGEDGHVNSDNVSQFTYLKKIIDEVLRKHFHMEFIGRIAEEDTMINGYLVPKGTTVHLFIDSVFKDPRFWRNPHQFDPEHFNPDQVKQRNVYAFKPFGFAGKRQCPGYMFAYSEMTVILAELVRRFKFESVEGAVASGLRTDEMFGKVLPRNI